MSWLSGLWNKFKSGLLGTLEETEPQQRRSSQESLREAVFGFTGRKEVGKSTIKKAICGESSLSGNL